MSYKMKKNRSMKILLMLIPLMLISLTMIASAHSDFTITDPHPTDGATDVEIHPSLPVNCTLTCTTGDNVTATAWYKIGVGGTVVVSSPSPEAWCNDTMNWNVNASLYGTTYYWGFNVSNTSTGHWTNTTFYFTTEDEPVNESSVYDDLDPQTHNILTEVLPILLAVMVLLAIVGIIFTIGLTTEGLITIMVTIVMGIIIIQVIIGL